MTIRPPRLLRILGLTSVAAAMVASSALGQSPRSGPGIVTDLPLVPVAGVAKEELLRSVEAQKSGGVQTMSPAHHECPNNTPHVQGISCGSTTNDALTTTGSCQLQDLSYIDFYAFSGTAGQTVTISMSSATFDAYLFLLKPDGTTVAAQDDDSGGGTNARIVFTLDVSGNWFIGANAFDPSVTGDYTLVLTCSTGGGGACVTNSTTHCLLNGRYRVTVTFTPPTGTGGDGQALQPAVTSDTGLFWFFSSNNIEVIIKVVSGCGFNSRVWVFSGGLTNVAYTITVTDTVTGISKTYSNPQGTPSQPIQDTAAFVCS